MSTRLIQFVFLILISSFVSAQEMPFDFSTQADNFTAFSGSQYSFASDQEDASNDVGQFFNDGSAEWQGFTVDLIRAIDLDFQKTISLSFYGFDPNQHTIMLKLEKGANQDVEVVVNVPSGGGWTQNVSFDFSDARLSSDGSTAVNATGKYDRLTLFIDGGTTTSGTYLIDDIDDGSEGRDPNILDVEYTRLVWEDNFNTEGRVDDTKWHHQTQVIVAGQGWANGEVQHYTDRLDNSFVDKDGFLHIVAKKENFRDQELTKDYTSARLNSKFAFTYGRVDIRAKMPIEKGTWPALWMLGKNINEDGAFWDDSHGTTSWPACGEIDIMEHGIFPSEDINYIASALHTPCCHGGNPNKGGTIADNLGSDFHIYSVNWSPNQITFLLDGEAFYTYNPTIKDASTWPFDKDQFLLLNVAMGGIAGDIVSNFTEGEMLVDYVRVYQESTVSTKSPLNFENETKVYPNPASNTVTISSNEPIDRFVLTDLYGKQLIEENGNTHQLDVSELISGIYFLTIYSGTHKTTKRVIVR